ncbi:hypothetical protein [uncultured Microscilla sp.]|uniref:hypothetical protein n=1 Tax=uncultured Microscilla sp. TaxID=432653 RepID=UPI002614C888|nr:hypothetical protein [uncultured Microscilla sp.]
MKYLKILFSLVFLLVLITSCLSSKQAQSTAYPIAYSSKTSGNVDIYLTDTQGKAKIKVTTHANRDGYAAWSPDGKRIACYAYHDGRKTWSIHTLNADGSNRKRLTQAKNKWDNAPAWSPDGKKIAFARAYKSTEGAWTEELWVMNADGSEQKQIKSLAGGGPHFTPDGKLLFHSKTNTSEICIANIDGSNLTKLTNNNAEDWHPEVSPDGKQVAFMSDRDGNHEVYVMDIDGANQKRLTFNKVRDSTPSWSPDGSKLIFTSQGHIYMMNKDGSSIKKIIPNAGQAAWLKINNK